MVLEANNAPKHRTGKRYIGIGWPDCGVGTQNATFIQLFTLLIYNVPAGCCVGHGGGSQAAASRYRGCSCAQPHAALDRASIHGWMDGWMDGSERTPHARCSIDITTTAF